MCEATTVNHAALISRRSLVHLTGPRRSTSQPGILPRESWSSQRHSLLRIGRRGVHDRSKQAFRLSQTHATNWCFDCSGLFVQTATTPNDDALKFLPGQAVSSTTHEFLTPSAALPSPLGTALFGVNGVRTVFFGPDFVSITKEPDATWALMKPEIYSLIIEHFTSGTPLFRDGRSTDAGQDGPEDTRILDSDSETVAQIKELLDTRVRPAIQEDGGDIEYRGFSEGAEGDGLVRLSLKGSCRGCSSSVVTLKSGIERMLMHYVPDKLPIRYLFQNSRLIAKCTG